MVALRYHSPPEQRGLTHGFIVNLPPEQVTPHAGSLVRFRIKN